MKRTVYFTVFVLCFLVLAVMCSRSSYSRRVSGFDAGEPLTPEGVESIIAAISEREAAVTEKYTASTDESGEALVFWTDSGKVWHISPECSSLRKSTNIKSGNISDAEAAGKERVCSVCGKGDS